MKSALPILVALAGLGALALSSSAKAAPPSGPGTVVRQIPIKKGQTWMLTATAVGGGTFGPADEQKFRVGFGKLGTIQSYLTSADGRMVVLVATFDVDTAILTNQLIASPDFPGGGVVITDAQEFAAGGPPSGGSATPALPETATPPLPEATPGPTNEFAALPGETWTILVTSMREPVAADEKVLNDLFPGSQRGSAVRENLSDGRVRLTFPVTFTESRVLKKQTPYPSDSSGHGIIILDAKREPLPDVRPG